MLTVKQIEKMYKAAFSGPGGILFDKDSFARAIEKEVREECAKACDARAEEHHQAWQADHGPRSDELWESYVEAQCCALAVRSQGQPSTPEEGG